jgi:hypothetical protein
MSRSGAFSIRKIAPVLRKGYSLEKITTIPARPPGAILAGSMKIANPSAKRKLPNVIQKNCFKIAPFNFRHIFF